MTTDEEVKEVVHLTPEERKEYLHEEPEKFERVPDEGTEEHRSAGVTSKIRERLHEAKQSAKERVHEEVHEVKEKVNPFSKTNKAQRYENKEHRKELKEEEKTAYREAEIQSARAAGKRKAEQKFGLFKPAQTAQTRSSSAPRMRSPASTLDYGLFGSAKGSASGPFGTSYYDLFGGSPSKKKVAPVRTTTYNPRTGKVTTTEPILEASAKKGFEKKEKPWSPFDLISGPELHVKGIPNQLNFGVASAPRKSKKGKKSKHVARHRGYNIGDLIY